ncbi:hypothetical protein C8J56DRAFT_207424 [Mycena floridula]|nr:hypothetical protein C8J56DRAFT_207424 [Mycena floridula]
MVMLRIMLYLGFTLIHSLSHLVAGISLSGPSTDVTVNTTIACQWTAESLEDPETFSLVMQFSDGKTDFGDRALITIIRRGNTTNGTMSNIPNVHDLGPHRLAAYADPFDPTSQPFSVSPSFLVVPSSDAPTSSSDNTVSPIPTSPSSAVPTSSSDNAVSPIPTRLSTSTSSLTSVALRSVSSSDSSLSPSPTSSSSIVIQSLSFPSQSIDVSMASSSSSAKNLNWHLAVIITAILLCAVLAGILILLYLWRRKKQRNLLEVLRPRSFTLTEDRCKWKFIRGHPTLKDFFLIQRLIPNLSPASIVVPESLLLVGNPLVDRLRGQMLGHLDVRDPSLKRRSLNLRR